MIIRILTFFLILSASSIAAQQEFKVYIFLAEECPISIYMTKPLQKAIENHHAYAEFIGVFPMYKSDDSTATAFLKEYGLTAMDKVIDTDKSISVNYGARVTPEAVIVDRNDQLLYRGRINSAYSAPGKMKHGPPTNDLDEVLEKLRLGKEVEQPWPKAVGCIINLKSRGT